MPPLSKNSIVGQVFDFVTQLPAVLGVFLIINSESENQALWFWVLVGKTK
jgi:hypothetical protein